MTGITLTLAGLGSLVAWRAPPPLALCVYCAGLVLYPQALTIQVGSADFSLSRILILAVLANALFRAELYRFFRWSWMDTVVCAAYLLALVALLHSVGVAAIERHGGTFFDTLLPYFAARLIVREESDFVALAKGLALIAVPLVGLGCYQMLTGHNPIGDLSVYYHFGLAGQRAEDNIPRLGMYRAAVTFTHPIAFGLFCAMVAPLAVSLRCQHDWPTGVVWALAAVAGVGVFASLSSGPWLAAACAALVFVAYLRWRLAVRLVLFAAVVLVAGAWYADAPYVDALAAFTFKPGTALYRVGLIQEITEGGMSGHWLTGYGYVGVGAGSDNTNFLWQHEDLVNVYIQVLIRTGLLGLAPYLLANGLMYIRLIEALRVAPSPPAAWLSVSMLAAMVGWNVALLTVGALSQVLQLLYMAFAMSANMPRIVTSGTHRAP